MIPEGQATTASTAQPEHHGEGASPIPPLFWWSLFIPTFAVLVWSLQIAFNRIGGGPVEVHDPDRDDSPGPPGEPQDPDDGTVR